jgi:hypothetical protein
LLPHPQGDFYALIFAPDLRNCSGLSLQKKSAAPRAAFLFSLVARAASRSPILATARISLFQGEFSFCRLFLVLPRLGKQIPGDMV